MILAFFAIAAGFPGSPFMHHWFQAFVLPGEAVKANFGLMMLSSVVALSAIGCAYYCYIVKPEMPARITQAIKPLYQASLNKLWFDEIYGATVVRLFQWLAGTLFLFDQKIVDGAVNGSARVGLWISKIKNWIDQYIVDGAVNLVGAITRITSSILRLFQTGVIHHYLLVMFIGILMILYGITK